MTSADAQQAIGWALAHHLRIGSASAHHAFVREYGGLKPTLSTTRFPERRRGDPYIAFNASVDFAAPHPSAARSRAETISRPAFTRIR